MKVIFFIKELGYGGQERQMTYALEALKVKGVDVELIVWDNSGDKTIYGLDKLCLELHELSGSEITKLIKARKVIKNKLKQEKSVIVQSWAFPLNFYLGVCTWGNKAIPIGALRADFDWLFKSIKGLRKLKLILDSIATKYVISNNRKGAASLERFRKKWLLHQKIFYLSNRLKIEKHIGELSKNTGVINSISAGSLLPHKKWDFLIDTIGALYRRGLKINHIHMGENGPLLEQLKEKVDKLMLKGVFNFIGQKTDVHSYYGKSDIMIHTAEAEGTPNVILEGMSCGLPIFTSNCGDVSDFVDNSNGYVFDEYDSNKWAEIISDSIINGSYKEMGLCSKLKAQRLLNIDNIGNDLKDIYKNVTNEK